MNSIPFEDFLIAYKDCRKNKRSTANALEFEVDYLNNLYKLYEDVNNYKYEIGRSICFVVTRPKPREVFAANLKKIVPRRKCKTFNSFF